MSDKPQKNKLKLSLLMVGVGIPPNLMAKLAEQDASPGMQGFNHQWSMIRGIEEASGRLLDQISYPPISTYPFHPMRYISGGKWHHHPEANDVYVPVINMFPFKLLFRFLVMSFEIVNWLWKNRYAKQRLVFLYSSQSSQLYAVLFSSIFFNMCKFAILTDPASMDLPSDSFFKKKIRVMDRHLQKYALKKFQGLIVLAERLATDYAPDVPYIVAEGVSPKIEDANEDDMGVSSNLVVAFAGTLKNEYGIRALLDSMQYLDKNIEMWIFGGGELEDDVRKCAAHDSRVKCFGFVQPEELRKITRKATAFISPLPTKGWFTHYKFPSKLLEYLAMNRPVISTRYPTIPKEYEPYMIWIDEETPKGIAKAIRKLQSMSVDERRVFAKQGHEFVSKYKSEKAQGERVWSFTSQISREHSEGF